MSRAVLATVAAVRRYEKLRHTVTVHVASDCPYLHGGEVVPVPADINTKRCPYCFG